jgi:hypothetical protein
MAGVLERIGWPQRRLAIKNRSLAPRVDRRVLELQTAKEILAEVFQVKISDVEEMILNRYEESCYVKRLREEEEMWPQEFVLGECVQ